MESIGDVIGGDVIGGDVIVGLRQFQAGFGFVKF